MDVDRAASGHVQVRMGLREGDGGVAVLGLALDLVAALLGLPTAGTDRDPAAGIEQALS